MSQSEGSVTFWIQQLKQDDPDALAQLWKRYYPMLLEQAQKRLGQSPKRVSGEEEVASDVLLKLFQGARAGRFAELQDRTDLWRLLVAITRQVAIDQLRQGQRQKRGGGDVRGESVFLKASSDSALHLGLDGIGGDEPGPDFAVACDEQFQILIGDLEDDSQRAIAQLRLEGYANEEIAERLNLSLRSIERKLKSIRERWAARFQQLQGS